MTKTHLITSLLQENIHQAAGVLDTNCFEIKTKEKVRIKIKWLKLVKYLLNVFT